MKAIGTASALVLVENEHTMHAHHADFQHQTGVQFHFIARYLPKVVPGTPFVYYRGVWGAGRIRRGQAEYFGCGVVGDVWEDVQPVDKLGLRYFCGIEEYVPFPKPVPSRIDGHWLEPISHPLGFQPSVRTISMELFRDIVARGGLRSQATRSATALLPDPPEVREVRVVDDLWTAPVSQARGAGSGGQRRSSYAAVIGDRAEELVLRYLRETLPAKQARTVEWVARRRPGWDIEYRDGAARVAVEVKGTAGATFTAVELTAREWSAAERLRGEFWLYLVAGCLSPEPAIQAIRDPFSLVTGGGWQVTPLSWCLRPPGAPS